MKLPSGLFAYELARGASAPEGQSLRYTLMTEIGLRRANEAGIALPFDLDEIRAASLAELASPELRPGDFGLHLWADALAGEQDAKLRRLVPLVTDLLREGFRPIVFCRFIDTAEYVASELAARLPRDLAAAVDAVTGRLAPEDREARIAELGEHELGKGGSAFVERAKRLQDVLGIHQDATVAEERIRAWTDAVGNGVAAGRLVELERARKADARSAWPEAWRSLERAASKLS